MSSDQTAWQATENPVAKEFPDDGGEAAAIRKMMAASQENALAAVALNAAGASLMGMHPSDSFCLWHVTEAGEANPITSGRLAELTGLTSGAITGVIDRLEAAGFVRRERDLRDRRKQLVRLVPERISEIYDLYAPLREMYRELVGRYDTADRELILEYLRFTASSMRKHVSTLREMRKNAGAPS